MGLPVVSLISPLDLANFTSPTVIFDAKYEDTIDSLLASVVFEVDTVNTFDSGNLKTVTYLDVASGTTARFITTLENGTWYWRVTATNTDGTIVSSIYSLTVSRIIKRVLYNYENIAKYGPDWTKKRALYHYENVAKHGPDWTKKRTLYQYENITDDPPFPWIESLSNTAAEPGGSVTIYGSGFGAKLDNDPLNEDRSLRGYGGKVLIGTIEAGIVSWSWTEITIMLPANVPSGQASIKVVLTTPDPPGDRESASIAFTVLGPKGAPYVGIELRVSPGNLPNTVIAILENAKNKSFQKVLSAPGAGRFLISRLDEKGGDRAIINDGNIIRCYYDGLEQFAWVIESRRPHYVESTHEDMIEVSGRGVLSVLERAIVYPNAYPNHTSLERKFSNVSGASIMGTLIQEANARGAIPFVSYDFTGATDSAGNPWTDMTTITIHAGENLLSVAEKLHNMGCFDLDMDSAFMLHAYTKQGADLSDEIIYEPGNGVLDHQNFSDSRSIVNALLTEGDEGLLAEVSDAQSQNTWGRREGYLLAASFKDKALLMDYSNKALTSLRDCEWGIQLQTDSEPYRAFIDYTVGDDIKVLVTPTEIDTAGFTGKLRVMGITLEDAGENYAVAATLDLNTMLLEKQIKLQQQMERALNKSSEPILTETDKKPSVPAPVVANKGDLLVYDGKDWVQLLAGTDGQVLTVDSTQDAGIKWA